MPSRSLQVRAYFDQTHLYLDRNYNNIRVRCQIVKELLGEIHGRRILDLGSGDGSISRQFLSAGNFVTMVDLSSAMLEKARAATPAECLSRAEYRNVDLFDLEAANEYDIVLCIGLLAHVESVEQTIERVAQLVKSGGRCILQISDDDQISCRLFERYQSARASFTRILARVQKRSALLLTHSLNDMTLAATLSVAARHGLTPVATRRYSLQLPGMGRLPANWLLSYSLLVARSPLLSRYGCEALILCEKSGCL